MRKIYYYDSAHSFSLGHNSLLRSYLLCGPYSIVTRPDGGVLSYSKKKLLQENCG